MPSLAELKQERDFIVIINRLSFFLVLSLSFFTSFCFAVTSGENKVQHPFYVGVMGGYGSTTWKGLVPNKINQNLAISMSTPIDTREGGDTWGVFVGHEFTPFFAVEANYTRYPNANIAFDTISIFSFNNDGKTEFTTHTETVSLMGKIMLIVPNTKLRVYSSAGVANLHREDMLNDDWRLTPTFGLGLNYHLSEHLMAEIGGNYTAGFGESQLNPTDTYFPFLYSFAVHVAYCF